MKSSRNNVVDVEDRLIEQRSKVFKAMLRASETLDISKDTFKLQEELDKYMMLLRLKKAYVA